MLLRFTPKAQHGMALPWPPDINFYKFRAHFDISTQGFNPKASVNSLKHSVSLKPLKTPSKPLKTLHYRSLIDSGIDNDIFITKVAISLSEATLLPLLAVGAAHKKMLNGGMGMNGWMNGGMNGRMNGGMNGRMNGGMNGGGQMGLLGRGSGTGQFGGSGNGQASGAGNFGFNGAGRVSGQGGASGSGSASASAQAQAQPQPQAQAQAHASGGASGGGSASAQASGRSGFSGGSGSGLPSGQSGYPGGAGGGQMGWGGNGAGQGMGQFTGGFGFSGQASKSAQLSKSLGGGFNRRKSRKLLASQIN